MPAGGMDHAQFVTPTSKFNRFPSMSQSTYHLELAQDVRVLRLTSVDGTNRLTRECVCSLTDEISRLAIEARPLVICGNQKFFSAGADLQEISVLECC